LARIGAELARIGAELARIGAELKSREARIFVKVVGSEGKNFCRL